MVVEAIATLVLHLQVSKYVSAAGFVLLLWDQLLLLPQEVKLVWPARWSAVKTFFLINRVLVPVFLGYNTYLLSGLATGWGDRDCQRWLIVSSFVEIISLAMSNYMLLMRLYCLYGRRKGTMQLLYIFYAVTYLAVFAIAIVSTIQILPSIHYSSQLGVCFVTQRPVMLGAVWATPIAFEILVFAMTFKKAWDQNYLLPESPLVDGSPLADALFNDGLLYSTVIIMVRFMNMVIWLVAPISLLYLGVYFLWAIVTALISRIFLNLRGVATAREWDRAHNTVTGDATLAEKHIESGPLSAAGIELKQKPRESDSSDEDATKCEGSECIDASFQLPLGVEEIGRAL